MYGNFKHLVIRKNGQGFRMDRIDKVTDPALKKKFNDKVSIEVQKEALLLIDRMEEKARIEQLKEYEEEKVEEVKDLVKEKIVAKPSLSKA